MICTNGPRLLVVGMLGLLLLLAPAVASADLVGTLFSGNSALTTAGFTGPYATVTIHLVDSTHATVTYDSLTQTISGTTYLYLLGGAQAADFNSNGTVTATVTGTGPAGFTPGAYTPAFNAAGTQVDGQGNYNLTVDSFDGFTHSASEIIISLTLSSGSWASAADVKVNNASGFWAAGHIFVCTETAGVCSTTSINPVTGFAGGAVVPEPGTLALLGTGLVALGALGRRFKK